jgi:nicotinic acid phosphoribosyltransferase
MAAKLVKQASEVDFNNYTDEEIIQTITNLKNSPDNNAIKTAAIKDGYDVAGLLKLSTPEINNKLQHDRTNFLNELKNIFKRVALLTNFSLRRAEPDFAATCDTATAEGGFAGAAHVLANLAHRYAGKVNKPITGTMAHAFIMQYTAVYEQALKEHKGKEFRAALGINEDKYLELVKNNQGLPVEEQVNIYDYICFCAYIRGIEDIEEATNNKGSKKIILLVDTTHTLAGVRAAMEAAITMGRKLDGVRLDTRPLDFLVPSYALIQDKIKQESTENKKLLENVGLFSTDGVDLKVMPAIIKQAVMHAIPNTPSGIGSAVGNVSPAKIKRQKLSPIQVNDLRTKYKDLLSQDFTLRKRMLETENLDHLPKIIPDDPFNNDYLPSDLYAMNQSLVIECVNKRLQKFGIKTVKKAVATSVFRPRSEGDNYLVVAGMDNILRTFGNFSFDKKFVDNLKNNTTLAFSDAQFEQLYKIAALNKKGKLELEINALCDGEVARPGTPLMTVAGNPNHVLMVESFITSTIGGMSAVATAAYKITHAFEDNLNLQLLEENENYRIKICKLYGLSVDLAKNNDIQAILQSLKDKKTPQFVYSGLDEQRSLSPFQSYAAMIGGFDATTMSQSMMPVVKPEINYQEYGKLANADKNKYKTVRLDFNDATNIEDLVKIMSSHDNKHLNFQIYGNLTADDIIKINNELLKLDEKDIPELSRIQFLIRRPLSDAENQKGLVYKITGVEVAYNNENSEFLQTVKAAGANDGIPNEKTSTPAIEPGSLLLRDAHGKPLAQMTIDFKILRDQGIDVSNPHNILAALKQQGELPILYYKNGAKLDLSEDSALFSQAASAELLLRQADKVDGTLSMPAIQDPKTSLNLAIKLARKRYKENTHKLPILMEPKLYQQWKKLLKKDVDLVAQELPEGNTSKKLRSS